MSNEKVGRIILPVLIAFMFMNSCISVQGNSHQYIGKYVKITGYYSDYDLSEFLTNIDSKAQTIIERYNPGFNRIISIRLYSSVDSFHNAGYGRKGEDGSVGNARNGSVYMVNPYCSKVHSYPEMLQIGVHEFTHVIISDANESMPIWLNEGIAMLEAQQGARYGGLKQEALSGTLPYYDNLAYDYYSANSVYKYSRSLVEYIIDIYSIEKLRAFIIKPDPKTTLGISNEEFQENWKKYLIAKKI